MRLFSQEKKDVKGLRGLMYKPHLGRGTNEAKNVFLPHNLKYGFECAGSLQVMWCFRALLYLNCYLPLCDLHGWVGMAPSCV